METSAGLCVVLFATVTTLVCIAKKNRERLNYDLVFKSNVVTEMTEILENSHSFYFSIIFSPALIFWCIYVEKVLKLPEQWGKIAQKGVPSMKKSWWWKRLEGGMTAVSMTKNENLIGKWVNNKCVTIRTNND